MANFVQLIADLNAMKDNLTPSELIKKVLELTGYEAELMKDKNAENESRLENIYEFIGVAKEFEEEEAEKYLKEHAGQNVDW